MNKVFRYMPFTQFVSLIETEQLYFPTVKQLEMEDPFEGKGPLETEDPFHLSRRVGTSDRDDEIQRNDTVRVSSWHLSENESYAMWKIYSKGIDGVAIETTIDDIYDSIILDGNRRDFVRASKIEYLDYRSEMSPSMGFLCKRKEFEYEKEMRLWFKTHLLKGVQSIPFDINKMINKIYVDPWSADWFLDLVISISTRYNLDSQVVKSTVRASPREFYNRAGGDEG